MKKKIFLQLFLLKKHVSHNFTLIKAEKTQKNSTPFFKNFYKFGSPYRVKAEKTQKHFSTPFFENFYKFWSPYRVKISIFGKNFSDNFFYSKNLFHTISHWLKPKKTQKKVSTPFFKNFRKFWSPYEVKAAKTQKHLSIKFSKHF